MLRLIGGICCLLLALGLLYAGVVGVLPKPEPAAPALILSDTDKDFGDVEQLTDIPVTLTLTNTFAEAVEIGTVSKSCSCTEAKVEPKTIPPGGTATVNIKWKMGNKPGPTGAAIAIHARVGSEERDRILTAQLKANVVTPVWIEPKQLTLSSAEPKAIVTVQSKPGTTFALIGATSAEPKLKLTSDVKTNTVAVELTGKPDTTSTTWVTVYLKHDLMTELTIPVRLLAAPTPTEDKK
jgi:hypothetical protein